MKEDLTIPRVVPHADIEAAIIAGQCEERPLHRHETLRRVLPPASSVAFAWVDARASETIERVHDKHALVLVIVGRAHLEEEGTPARAVASGDVLTVPPNTVYKLSPLEPLRALIVVFDQDGETASNNKVHSLDDLLNANEVRSKRFDESAFIRMLEDGTLSSDARCATLMRELRRFSDVFQKVIFTRQATTSDRAFEPTFLAHFREELGHNSLLAEDDGTPSDPILSACATWFVHQMLVLDNADKTVLIHLVLETAGHRFHSRAKVALAPIIGAQYFGAHSEVDLEHKDIGINLVAGMTPVAYERLHRVLEDGWDMFEAFARRMVELVMRSP